MTNEINILRFLTSVRNDPFPYYDTVSKGGGINAARNLQLAPMSFRQGAQALEYYLQDNP